MSATITDESLMAFADGELAPVDAAVVREAVAADPDLAARVALFRETRRLAKAVFDPIAREPVPEVLVSAIVPSASRAAPARTGSVVALRSWRPAALAASVALAAGLAGYALAPAPPPSTFAALGRGEPALAAALTESADGARRPFDGGGIRVGATYRLEGGRTCRTFELSAAELAPVSGLSCREDGAWRVSVATPGRLPEAAAEAGGYRPATGDVTDLAALLDARHADGPLPPEEVERLRASGWSERR